VGSNGFADDAETRFEFVTRAHEQIALVDALDWMQRLMKE
jgi:hypothetical protein